MTCAILRGNKSRNERSRKHRGRVPSIRSNFKQDYVDGRGFILCLVFPFRGRLPLVARVHRLFRLERNGYFFSPFLPRLENCGRKDTLSRWDGCKGNADHTHGRQIYGSRINPDSCCVRYSIPRVSILLARIDFDWYSRRLRASTPSVINHCETRQGNALSRPVETSRSPNFCKLHPSDISLPL